MENFYIAIGLALLVFVVGFIALPFAKSKGWINKNIAIDIAEKVDTGIDIVNAVVKAIEVESVNVKAVNSVLDIADIATDYVVDLIDTDNKEDKVNLSLDVVDKVFKEIGLSPTESQKNLIDIVIRQGVDFLEEKKKTVAATPTM
ncbi:hypothetical protein SAMN04487895_101783 [Paenibacillus sophorae]|uniref:Bacteriophage holin of superfamily 6 (Holin_LLH) n=1 Tax=Paenibacillus sophorae TaxID=1333845 RepID=A0A1H8H8A1_9BACL|nr:hypothetical protein [Paenibacillus sophorae]QWU14473.1 hypothetical protein KP014_21430 [Paenibacillus sophorae]SEN52325.1 hypothetical protein SAMN04487895_101783 [Paenibacillus sophorae]